MGFNSENHVYTGLDAMTRLTERIAQNVRERRLAAGLSQEGLARLASVSAATVSRIERGHTTRPRQDEFERIATALGVTSDDLMGLDDDNAAISAGTAEDEIRDILATIPGARIALTNLARGINQADEEDQRFVIDQLKALARRFGKPSTPSDSE